LTHAADLGDLVDRLVAGWHPALRRLLADADPVSRAAIEFTASLPTPPWPTSDVTVLGDAIHTMPATGGLGGNTALRDAHLLTRMLRDCAQGRLPLLDAIGRYEQLMRAHGYAAVEEALTTKDQMLAEGTWRAVTARTWFRLCRAVPAVRRRTFGSWAGGSRPQPWENLDTPVA
jgi:2-polyprenyl-6-methoxyphenol hydroxylase-like FAD-dependent oxidoreductase